MTTFDIWVPALGFKPSTVLLPGHLHFSDLSLCFYWSPPSTLMDLEEFTKSTSVVNGKITRASSGVGEQLPWATRITFVCWFESLLIDRSFSWILLIFQVPRLQDQGGVGQTGSCVEPSPSFEASRREVEGPVDRGREPLHAYVQVFFRRFLRIGLLVLAPWGKS